MLGLVRHLWCSYGLWAVGYGLWALSGALQRHFVIIGACGAWLSRAAFCVGIPDGVSRPFFIDIYPENLILSSHGVCRRRAAFRSLSAKKGVIVWTIS